MLWLIPVSILVMFCLMVFRQKHYQISIAKSIIILIYTAVLGFLGTKVLFWIENGLWMGMSFFGAVLFLPLLLFPLAKFLRISYGALTDFVALPGLSMFTVLKAQCYFKGCCGGLLLGYTPQMQAVYFPIQLVEAGVTVAIIGCFLILEQKNKTTNKLYPWCLVVYGIARFALNWFRLDDSDPIFWLPKGNFWAVLSILMGSVWLLVVYGKEVQQKISELS